MIFTDAINVDVEVNEGDWARIEKGGTSHDRRVEGIVGVDNDGDLYIEGSGERVYITLYGFPNSAVTILKVEAMVPSEYQTTVADGSSPLAYVTALLSATRGFVDSPTGPGFLQMQAELAAAEKVVAQLQGDAIGGVTNAS